MCQQSELFVCCGAVCDDCSTAVTCSGFPWTRLRQRLGRVPVMMFFGDNLMLLHRGHGGLYLSRRNAWRCQVSVTRCFNLDLHLCSPTRFFTCSATRLIGNLKGHEKNELVTERLSLIEICGGALLRPKWQLCFYKVFSLRFVRLSGCTAAHCKINARTRTHTH